MNRLQPILRTADLVGRDGHSVVLEGVYERRLSQRKMNDPALHFFGFVDLRLEGGVVRLSSSRRGAEEVEALEGKRVRVRGTLRLDVQDAAHLTPEHARPDPVPTLLDPSEPELVA